MNPVLSRLLLAWEFHPSVIAGCVLLLLWYFRFVNRRLDLKAVNFTAGVLTIFLALCSPIDPLSDHYLFSAHMLQHIMTGVLAPAMMVAGLSLPLVEGWLKISLLVRLERIFSNPALAMAVGLGTFSIWHIPVLYDLTIQSETIHILEHITLLISGVILWWPVLKPNADGRLAPMPAIVYLSIATFLQSILGIGLSLADTLFYSAYLHPEDELGLLRVLRDEWGISPLDDQKAGGAIMWTLGGVAFLWVMMVVMVDWFREEHPDAIHNAERRT